MKQNILVKGRNILCLISIFSIYGAAGLSVAGAENGQFSYLWAALILGMCLQAVNQELWDALSSRGG